VECKAAASACGVSASAKAWSVAQKPPSIFICHAPRTIKTSQSNVEWFSRRFFYAFTKIGEPYLNEVGSDERLSGLRTVIYPPGVFFPAKSQGAATPKPAMLQISREYVANCLSQPSPQAPKP
jgi:hypothetical protein